MSCKKHKVLHSIGNLELINHVLFLISDIGTEDNIIVCSDFFDFENRSFVKLKKVIQRQPLGTANAVSASLEYLKNDAVVILYADTPLVSPQTVNCMINQIKNDDCDMSLLLFFPQDLDAQYGRAVLSNDNLIKIVEFKDLEQEQKRLKMPANSGVMVIKTDVLKRYLPHIKNDNAQKEYYLTDIVDIASSNGLCIKYQIANDQEALGVNTLQDLETLESFFQKKTRAKMSQNGVIFLDSKTNYFSYDTKIEGGAVLHQNVIFGKNVNIQEKAEIFPFCYIENADICSGAKIGPFARIRGQTYVGNHAEVGNFVEVKNSNIKNNVKVKHLSYIGDCQIGSHCNIGAGTIFCNFDGKAKRKTVLGKNCFIGANNSVVAPVNFGNGVKTGAGSTLTKDIPDGYNAIARSYQVNIKQKD